MKTLAGFPSLIMLASGFITSGLAAYTWKRRAAPGRSYFVLMTVAVAIFAFSNAAEYAARTLEMDILWAKISYIGVTSVSPLWLMFAISYNQQKNWQPKAPLLAALWLLPLTILLLAFTNERHGLIWPAIERAYSLPGSPVIYSHGIGVWVHAAFAYSALLAGSILLIQAARRSSTLHRWQIGTVIIAAVVPWLGNIVYILNLTPWPGLDLTPVAFSITGILLAGSVFKYQLFDLRPVAFEAVFSSLVDGVVVIDTNNRLAAINPVGMRQLGLTEGAIGKNLFKLPSLDTAFLQYEHALQAQDRLDIVQGAERRHLHLTISPLYDASGALQGRVALLHDVSQEQNFLEKEQRRSRQLDILNEITQTAIGATKLDDVLQNLTDKLGELFGADGAYLTLWDEYSQQAVPKSAFGVLKTTFPDRPAKPGHGTITKLILDSGNVLTIENVRASALIPAEKAEEFIALSLMAIPLISGDKKLGSAVIAHNQRHTFTAEEYALAEQIGGQFALTIARIQLLETETQRVSHLTALQSVSDLIVSSLEPDQVFSTIVNILHATFNYKYVSIYRLYGDNLHLHAQVGYPEESILWDIPVSSGVMGRSIRTRQPQFIQDTATDPDFLRAAHAVMSEICVPLTKRDVVLGVLNIESTSEQHLSESDMQLLLTVANQVTIAIENASLFEAEREQRKLAQALREVGLALSENLNYEVVLDRLLVEINRVIPYDSASVLLMEKDLQTVYCARMRGFEQYGEQVMNMVKELRMEVKKVTTLTIMTETGNPLIVSDTVTNPLWSHVTESRRSGSWAGAPISLHNQVIGYLSLEKIERHFYRPAHAEMLTAFTSQAAVALENARLYSEVQQQAIIDELTGLYNRRGIFDLGEREIERADRLGYPLSALFIDIDHFKLFNDTYSYAVGDKVLRLLAICLKSNLREFDVIGRYGGEEFIALLPEIDINTGRSIAERVRQAAQNLNVKTERETTHFTISIGVCQRQPARQDLGTLLQRAGQALHEAKEQGRNMVMITPFNETE